jgi:hypothetical protein
MSVCHVVGMVLVAATGTATIALPRGMGDSRQAPAWGNPAGVVRFEVRVRHRPIPGRMREMSLRACADG